METIKPWLHLGGLGIAVFVLMWTIGTLREEMKEERKLCQEQVKELVVKIERIDRRMK